MKRSTLFFAGIAIAFLFAGNASAQSNLREDDHFTRTLAVSRIDLDEKMNRPIAEAADPALYTNASQAGMIDALMRGLKEGRYKAYHPDTLNKSMNWDELKVICEQMYGTEDEEIFFNEVEIDESCDWCDDSEEEEWVSVSNVVSDSDPFISEASYVESIGGYTDDGNFGDVLLAPMNSVVELIENRIFDKNRSDMVYDIAYIRIVWVDPGETLPDQNVICLKYADVVETLEACQWTNRFNEAEHRNLREVLELRLFNSYDLQTGSRNYRTLAESNYHRNQQIAFEHHLWSY
jgi:hypothetical protein